MMRAQAAVDPFFPVALGITLAVAIMVGAAVVDHIDGQLEPDAVCSDQFGAEWDSVNDTWVGERVYCEAPNGTERVYKLNVTTQPVGVT